MGYDLRPANDALEEFHFSAYAFPMVLEICNYLWPACFAAGRWNLMAGVDDRMPEGDQYPQLLSNDGFQVTAEEARIVGRMVRNYVIIQRGLPESHRVTLATLTPPWPARIRDDWVDRLEQFASWAEQSGGFEIW